MSNSLIALALVVLALGVTLMEVSAAAGRDGAPSLRGRADVHSSKVSPDITRHEAG